MARTVKPGGKLMSRDTTGALLASVRSGSPLAVGTVEGVPPVASTGFLSHGVCPC